MDDDDDFGDFGGFEVRLTSYQLNPDFPKIIQLDQVGTNRQNGIKKPIWDII